MLPKLPKRCALWNKLVKRLDLSLQIKICLPFKTLNYIINLFMARKPYNHLINNWNHHVDITMNGQRRAQQKKLQGQLSQSPCIKKRIIDGICLKKILEKSLSLKVEFGKPGLLLLGKAVKTKLIVTANKIIKSIKRRN